MSTMDRIKSVIDRDLPIYEVTEETRQELIEYGKRNPLDSVRLAMGRIYTDKEYQERRKRILNTPLP